MSFEITHTPHVCTKPSYLDLPVGTRGECSECGKIWEVRPNLFTGKMWLCLPPKSTTATKESPAPTVRHMNPPNPPEARTEAHRSAQP